LAAIICGHLTLLHLIKNIMRFLLLVTAFTGLVISCKQNQKQASRFDNTPQVDTTCLKALKKAKNDIENGKLTYCHDAGSLLYISLRSSHEMGLLLDSLELGYTEQMTSDVVYPDQTQGCYCDYMNERIQTKYGVTFIDSLLNLSDSLYVLNNMADTFYYGNCDTNPNYPGDMDTHHDEFSRIFQQDLERTLEYPTGYIKISNPDSSAFVNVDLYVDKEGNASITGYWFLFDMKVNHKYEDYFKNIISKAMKKTGWTPATIRNQKVNSDMVMRLYFD
jgi:hypothetical protein